VLLRF
jgi:Niemann-Pick C1 protein